MGHSNDNNNINTELAMDTNRRIGEMAVTNKWSRIRPLAAIMMYAILASSLNSKVVVMVRGDLSEYALSNDVNSYPVAFSGFGMVLQATETELTDSTVEVVRSLSQREIDSQMLMHYGMNYTAASYMYMDDLIFDDISFDGAEVAITVSKGYTYFNLPYGTSSPHEAGIDRVVEDAVSCDQLVDLLGQTGLQDLSLVYAVSYKNTPIATIPPSYPNPNPNPNPNPVAIESEREAQPISKPNYIPVVISMAVLASLLSFFVLLFVYRHRRQATHPKDSNKSPPTTPSTINKDPNNSFNSDFILSKSSSDMNTPTLTKLYKNKASSSPKKAFPIMLRKDMLSPTDTAPHHKIPFMDKHRRREEEGNTVLASSYFTAPPDAMSAVSSIDFEVDSTWDPNDTMEDGNQDPFMDAIPESQSRVLDNKVKLSRCRDDSVVL